MSALIEFAIFPIDHTKSKSAFVARVLDIIDQSGLPYQFTAYGYSHRRRDGSRSVGRCRGSLPGIAEGL